MYKNGELEEVMQQFEKSIKLSSVFVSGSMDK